MRIADGQHISLIYILKSLQAATFWLVVINICNISTDQRTEQHSNKVNRYIISFRNTGKSQFKILLNVLTFTHYED